MKVMKILGVVFGALLLLAGIALLAGSALTGATQRAIEDELAKQGLSGPVKGTVTSVGEGGTYTVSYTDKEWTAQTGTGPLVAGTEPPPVCHEVSVYYSTANPSQIAIVDLSANADFGGISIGLLTAAIICLIVGASLLLAGILGLVSGRRARAAATAGQGGEPLAVPTGQPPAARGQQQYPPPGQDPSGQQQPPLPPQQDSPAS